MPRTTVRDLIASQPPRALLPVAGHAGLDNAVGDVQAADIADASPAPGLVSCADLDPARGLGASHLVDVALHRHHVAGAAALVLCSLPEGGLGRASRRLADRMRLPLLLAPHRTSAQTAAALLLWTRGPDVQRAHQLTDIARALRAKTSLEGITRTLARHLHADVAALSPDGATIAGDRLGVDLLPYLRVPAPLTGTADGHAFAAHPLRSESGTPGTWLAARSAHGGPQWGERALAALSLAEAYASASLATSLMHAERDARFRTTLLEEILSSADDLPAGTAAAAGRVGWRLAGWHTAVHILRLRRHAPPPAAGDLVHALAGAGLTLGPPAERSGGWVGWTTSDRPPSGHDGPALVARVSEALRLYHARAGATPLVAGVGRPALGPAGLATTLAEARHAALATALADVPGGVQHVDRLGVTQVLMASCTSPSMRETAAGLLTPLLEDPAGPDLLRTLEAYFDCGCSASDTARRLGLHRNTVAQRLSRACTVLGVGLDTADERLALQLACRAHRLDAGPRRSPAFPAGS
ncbi:helix-turn-helix domain-containing protein [Streptomyces somaliensis DSM 40738]|uniref:PucR family transcriptional regulator n=1 Tax=Streptomyces somaliensis TaxID=78355 RepID=UPI0021C45E80|nr:helix-turn-helix domain-containing protein [Streptomyces somaliensis]MCQ0025501.1 helix-turn-helix domain-containing protein [Streptomyces somaliensis DSM 40738]